MKTDPKKVENSSKKEEKGYDKGILNSMLERCDRLLHLSEIFEKELDYKNPKKETKD